MNDWKCVLENGDQTWLIDKINNLLIFNVYQ